MCNKYSYYIDLVLIGYHYSILTLQQNINQTLWIYTPILWWTSTGTFKAITVVVYLGVKQD